MKPMKLLAAFAAVFGTLLGVLVALSFLVGPSAALASQRVDSDSGPQYAVMEDIVTAIPAGNGIPEKVYAVRAEVFTNGKSDGSVYYSVLATDCGKPDQILVLLDDDYGFAGTARKGGPAKWVGTVIDYVCYRIPSADKNGI